MFGLAIEDGGVAVNPVRESSARINVGKKSPRALAPEETTVLTQWFRSNDRAVALDLPDLVEWMLATGCRTGEALALRHDPTLTASRCSISTRRRGRSTRPWSECRRRG
jgi:integrase